MWSSWDEFKASANSWITWDDWILAAYRDRINFKSLRGPQKTGKLTSEEKDALLKTHREALLKAIKAADKQCDRQAALFIFAKLCVFLIATSSAFVISNIFGAHINAYAGLGAGLPALALKYGLGAVTFISVFFANFICFRKSVPDVIRKLFVSDETLGYHFFSPHELKIYKNEKGEIQCGYEVSMDNTVVYLEKPSEDKGFGWRGNLLLFVQFSLSVMVGLAIFAQTIDKAKGGMTGFLPFLVGTGVAGPLAWVMGCAAFVCMLGQYTYSTMRFLRNPDKTKELKAIFHSVNRDKSNKSEVYVYNACMALFVLGLSFFVALGMYGTSNVQAESFMSMIHTNKHHVARLAVCVCTVAGKALFTARALINFLGILCASVGAAYRKITTGEYKSPFVDDDAEDQISTPGGLAIGVFAIAKAFTAVDPPEAPSEVLLPGEAADAGSDLMSSCVKTQFFAISSVIGAGVRSAQEPLDKTRPKALASNAKF